MTRNSNALMRDGSVMAHSDLVDFLSGSTDSAIIFSGSADSHIPIHPPLNNLTLRAKPTKRQSDATPINIYMYITELARHAY